jgi:proteic killer suppression protein
MIKSFKHKGLEKFFCDGTLKGIQAKHADKLSDILDLLDAADTIQVMNFPGSRLHKLLPKKEEIWAVKVTGNWRIAFQFINGDAYDVDYTDYH